MTTKLPFVIQFVADGKTLAVFYANCRAELIARWLAIMGEPELICAGEYDPDVVDMLWDHQNMPEEMKDAIERWTTADLLMQLGYDKPEGGTK
jgi:hypothetical protein